ncbi:MAG: TonB-dependent receptor plug domain-containing protein [Saprospiraceae bacterium]|nr:TonB-dependent receptor plug domain-containing protein [Saprospiraceae bacterium]
MRIDLSSDTTVLIKLETKNTLQTVEINAQKQDRIENRVQMSQVTVPIEQIKRMPMVLGEADVFKTLQFLPGVKSGSEGTAGILVRGGSQDQNLVLLDGVPIYNPTHIGGLFSVFNADALRNVALTKGGFPARFGGRLSSVVEVETKDGHKKEFHAEAGIGLLLSKLTIEGPILRDKLSFMVSGRRTYLDLLLNQLINETNPTGTGKVTLKRKINFYDVNAKLNYIINDRHNLFFSIYQGFDIFQTDELTEEPKFESLNSNGFNFKNQTATLKWHWKVSNRLFSNTVLYRTLYDFNYLDNTKTKFENIIGDTTLFKFNSNVKDIAIKSDWDYLIDSKQRLKFGVNLISHEFIPSRNLFQSNLFDFDNNKTDTVIGGEINKGLEADIYVEDNFKFKK